MIDLYPFGDCSANGCGDGFLCAFCAEEKAVDPWSYLDEPPAVPACAYCGDSGEVTDPSDCSDRRHYGDDCRCRTAPCPDPIHHGATAGSTP